METIAIQESPGFPKSEAQAKKVNQYYDDLALCLNEKNKRKASMTKLILKSLV